MLLVDRRSPGAPNTETTMSTFPVDPASTPAPSSRPGRDLLRAVVVAIAALGQLVVAVPFTAASGLLAPLAGIVMAWVLWAGCAVAFVLVARRWPLATPLVPLVNVGLLALLITFGDLALGWTP
jgi:hypothetical protein